MKKIIPILFACMLLAGCADYEKAYNAGKKAEEAGDYTAAIASYQEAVNEDSSRTEALSALGYAQLNNGDSDGAEKTFNDLLEKDNASPAAYDGLCQIYLQKKDYASAAKIMSEAREAGLGN